LVVSVQYLSFFNILLIQKNMLLLCILALVSVVNNVYIQAYKQFYPDDYLNSAVCSHLSASQDVSGKFDFGKVALANGLQQPVVADVWLFVYDCRNRAATRWQTAAAG